jgi:catechol 2,3-dioxygenase-like lactoylglutathione lyase family enzyme
MSSGHIQHLHMVILMQQDLQAGIDFYTKLGLKLIFHIKDKWAEMKLGQVRFGLCPTGQLMDGHRTGLVLQVDDVRAFYEEHKESISFLNEPKEAVHGIMVSFKDPSGNILDVYQPTPEKVADLIKKAAEGDTADSKGNDACCMSTKKCCKVKEPDIACS